ncbi:hypothetical protein WICPIJ_000089 [Wickerhamomyces pijperi]|uniref:Sulfite efflux pump SSU1 n=1 Tax=Wickerhamomyces pijperi TaxID=599730 RepID=A0A9P8QEL9_WICPI|nr:hypothetical protein WICPIJ_000089 [Wickerhamomyces pijperi]
MSKESEVDTLTSMSSTLDQYELQSIAVPRTATSVQPQPQTQTQTHQQHPYTSTTSNSSPSIATQISNRIGNLITNFELKWFIITMGLGITSSIFYSFPYPHRALQIIGLVVFGFDSFVLLALLMLFTAHLLQHSKPGERRERGAKIMYDLDKNVFLGAFSMGICSWCSMLFKITGDRCVTFIWVLFWINTVLSLFTAFGVVVCILHKSKLNSHEITPTLLLPIVTIMVVSSFGQVIYPSLDSHRLKFTTVVFCFLLWALAVTLSFVITTVYFYRLIVHKLPSKEAIFTNFISLGFLGQGAYSVQLFGENYQNYLLLVNADVSPVPQAVVIEGLIFRNLGLLAGLFLQAFGFYLTAFAVAAVLTHYPLSVNFGWWAITFPCGTMSLGALQSYKLTGWEFERIISVIYAVILFAAVLVNSVVPCWRYVRAVVNTGLL